MPFVLSDFSRDYQKALMERHRPICGTRADDLFLELSQKNRFSPSPKLPRAFEDACKSGRLISGFEILQAKTVDEPDMGMDLDLSEKILKEIDPSLDRKWMGGATGPTSQGFRHQYFGGWKASSLLQTFQIPTRAIGQAPERVRTLSAEAKRLLADPSLRPYGFRVLGWALHYLQDLSQPYHSTQIPDLALVPWSKVFQFSEMTAEATRIIGNAHYAFEAFTAQVWTTEEGIRKCLEKASDLTTLQMSLDRDADFPENLALAQSELAVAQARAAAQVTVSLFGATLKQPGISFTQGIGVPEYALVARSGAWGETKDAWTRAVCPSLANAVQASRLLIHWALNP